MENLNKECCNAATPVNMYMYFGQGEACCTCDQDNEDAGSGGNAGTVDHDRLINKNLGIQHEASAIAFSDGETFQEKYDSGELIGEKGETGEKGDAGEKGEAGVPGVQGERGAAGLFVPDYGKRIDISQALQTAGEKWVASESGFVLLVTVATATSFHVMINGKGSVQWTEAADANYLISSHPFLAPVKAGDVIEIFDIHGAAADLRASFFPPVAALLPSNTADMAALDSRIADLESRLEAASI